GAQTITAVPGLELRYRRFFGSIIQLTLKSAFKYFHTEPIERSTIALSFESTSQWWLNEIDVEWRVPLDLWGPAEDRSVLWPHGVTAETRRPGSRPASRTAARDAGADANRRGRSRAGATWRPSRRCTGPRPRSVR